MSEERTGLDQSLKALQGSLRRGTVRSEVDTIRFKMGQQQEQLGSGLGIVDRSKERNSRGI